MNSRDWATAEEQQVRLAAGPGGTALKFDGTDDFAVVRRAAKLPRHNITVCAWIKVAKHKDYNRVLTHDWLQWGWNLYSDAAGVVRFGIAQQQQDYSAGRTIFQGHWHHVAGTYDGRHVTVYVDGVPGPRTPLRSAVLDDAGAVVVGGGTVDGFLGELDELAVFWHALSAAQVADAMRGQLGGREPGLAMLLHLDEAGGGLAFDASGNGNHAALGLRRRAPRWTPSSAPVAVPCIVPGSLAALYLPVIAPGAAEDVAVTATASSPGASLLRLQGIGGPDADPASRASVSPDSAPGAAAAPTLQLYGQLPQASLLAHPLRPAAAVSRNATGTAPRYGAAGDGGNDSAACLGVRYTARAAGLEAEGQLLVDVRHSRSSCHSEWQHQHGCWQQRLQLPTIRTRRPPPKVSVVVPLYNQGDVLAETIRSVAAQTLPDWELIIVNDGSTDGVSLSAALQLQRQHREQGARVSVLNQRNGGLADARNAGIRAAKGRWVLPLDSDDLIHPQLLESAVSILENEPGVNLVIADLQGFGEREYSWRIPEFSASDLRFQNLFHCSAVFERALWASTPAGYPTTTLFGYEDWAFWLHVQQHHPGGLVPAYIRRPWFRYRIRQSSMLQQLLHRQQWSLASVRLQFPGSYPAQMLLLSHDVFLSSAPKTVVDAVDAMVRKFPRDSSAHLMQGLLGEGAADRLAAAPGPSGTADRSAELARLRWRRSMWNETLQTYETAVQLSGGDDWQPLWRMVLVLRKLGQLDAANTAMQQLEAGFEDAAQLNALWASHSSHHELHEAQWVLQTPAGAGI